MYCTHCGQQTPEDAAYCARCGAAAKPPTSGAPRRLFRLRRDKKIAGICSGVAKYLDVDVTLIRILTVAIACLTGFVPGLIAYLVVWMIMPLEDYPAHT